MQETATDAIHLLIADFHEAKTRLEGSLWKMADLALDWLGLVGHTGEPGFWAPKIWKGLSAEVGLAPKTLMQYALTAKTFPAGQRHFPDEYLTFQHHLLCAHTADPRVWLALAAAENLSTAKLRRLILDQKLGQKPEPCAHLERRWCKYQGKTVGKEECDSCLVKA